MAWHNGSLLALSLFGVILAILGVVHLRKTREVFDFYRSFNDQRISEGRPWLQVPGGASKQVTRLFGWFLVALGVVAFVGGVRS